MTEDTVMALPEPASGLVDSLPADLAPVTRATAQLRR